MTSVRGDEEFRVSFARLLTAALLAGVLGGCGDFRDTAKRLFSGYTSGRAVEADHGVLFYGTDILTTPGSAVTLQARIRSPRSFLGIEGVTVSFYEKGKLLGSAVTADEGIARLGCVVRTPGQHVIELRPTRLPPDIDEDYRQAAQASARLLVDAQPARERFVVIDIDHTLVDEGWVNVLTKDKPSAMKRSVDAMRRISEAYHVIYLTRRPNALTARTKQWLQDRGMPPGVVALAQTRESLQSNREYKSAVLRGFRQAHPGIAIGVGDQASDAQAYLENGMTAYLIPPHNLGWLDRRLLADDLRKMPDDGKVQVVRDWKQVEQGVFEGRQFPPRDYLKRLE